MHKNWPKINEVGRQNRFLMLALATLEPGSEIAQPLMNAFPECFSETQIKSLPLSLLREYGRRESLLESQRHRNPEPNEIGAEYLQSYGALDNFHIPYEELATPDCDYADGMKLIPKDFPEGLKTGDAVKWEGKDFIVCENNEGVGILYIAPAECIDANS